MPCIVRISDHFPDLTDEDVLACIAFAGQSIRDGSAAPIPEDSAMNTMTYNGYTARIEYSHEDDCFVGHIAGIKDVVGFHGDSVPELHEAFAEAVERRSYSLISGHTSEDRVIDTSGKASATISAARRSWRLST